MDFRVFNFARCIWNGVTGGLQYSGLKGKRAPIIQTPPTKTTMFETQDRVIFEFHPVHPRFMTFMKDFCETIEVDPNLTKSDMFTWDGKGFKVQQFGNASDLNWYNPDGSRSVQVPVQCGKPFISSCLLQIKGIWKTTTSWGLKLHIKEVQIHPDDYIQYHENTWAFQEEEEEVDPFKEFMFIVQESM
jgi:hypothetical protein